MGKKYRNLYDRIYDWNNLLLAYKESKTGKSYSSSFLEFKEYYLSNLRDLQRRLITRTWEPDPQLTFYIQDPKTRLISCQSFRDRVLHHALIQVIGPIHDAAMMPQVYACRVGLGTHKCVTKVQQLLRQNPDKWILHIDFSKFFPTIPQDLLVQYIKKKITCEDTLTLIAKVLTVQPEGLPIGALTSQIFCNYWGSKLDRYVANKTGGSFVRYMDDAAIIVPSKAEGLLLKEDFCKYVAKELHQRIGKWKLSSTKQGITFCGFRIKPTHKLIKRQSLIRQRRKLKMALAHEDHDAWRQSLAAWMGHVRHADGFHALRHLGLAVSC
jgi:retron-type reverse transcriptase